MNRLFVLAFWLVAAGALALRLPELDLRPMHNDEANNAIKIQGLWESGDYRYDPNEFHGPSLYYLTLPAIWLSGAKDFSQLSERTLRSVPVACGVALVLLLWLVRDGLGRSATLWAAVLTAISPAMVFYSRYFIHEMLLVCFTMVALAGGWRYLRTRRLAWAVVTGAGLGLMYATKETFVLPLGAMGLASGLTWAWSRWRDGTAVEMGGRAVPSAPQERAHEDGALGTARPTWTSPVSSAGFTEAPPSWKRHWNGKHALVALGVATAVSMVLFTSFFTNLRGPLDSVTTYIPWLHRAGGHSLHVHPWSYYLKLLVWYHPAQGPLWSEALIVALALAGFVVAFGPSRIPWSDSNPVFVRFIACYGLILTVAYSIIPYKTPWCMLGFLHGLILLAGVGGVAWVRLARGKLLQTVIGLVLAAAGVHLGWEAWRASYPFTADRRNPYFYAQTVPNLLELVEKVEAVARVSPDGDQTVVKVIAPQHDYAPLLWYLRRFERTRWYDELADPYAPLMIVSEKFGAPLEKKSNNRYLRVGLFEMRPRVFFELYVKFDLWKRYVETLPRLKKE